MFRIGATSACPPITISNRRIQPKALAILLLAVAPRVSSMAA